MRAESTVQGTTFQLWYNPAGCDQFLRTDLSDPADITIHQRGGRPHQGIPPYDVYRWQIPDTLTVLPGAYKVSVLHVDWIESMTSIHLRQTPGPVQPQCVPEPGLLGLLALMPVIAWMGRRK